MQRSFDVFWYGGTYKYVVGGKQKLDVNVKVLDGSPALHNAAFGGWVACVQRLLECEVNGKQVVDV